MTYTPVAAAREKGVREGKVLSLKMADNITIYKGSMVCIDAAGYATTTPVASTCFAGIAVETVANTATGHAAGAKSVRVAITGVHSLTIASGGAQALVGTEVYWNDGSSGSNILVSASDTGLGAKVGRVVEAVSATELMVLITGYAFNVDAQAS